MKKNITINLFGTLYNIDEDAYQLLDNYLQSMKNYFSRQLNGDEIADDIEHRVAELLWEYKEKGIEAVSIDIIKEIIGKIGNPSEIDTNNGNEQPDQQSQSFASEEQGAGSGQRSNSGQSAGEAFQNFAHEAGRSATKPPITSLAGISIATPTTNCWEASAQESPITWASAIPSGYVWRSSCWLSSRACSCSPFT